MKRQRPKDNPNLDQAPVDAKIVAQVYEFEPVKQKNGVTFVSPVTKSDVAFNQRQFFVPHVANKRQNTSRQNFRIKRGSNVSRAATPTLLSNNRRAKEMP